MLRLLLPSILGFSFFIIALWIIYLIIMKYVKIGNLKPLKDFEKVVPIKNMFSIITIATAIIFSIYVINIASVNEVTRTSVDKSAQDDGKINFDSRMEKDTTRLK